MSIISAGTTSGTALVQTADTNGNLIIKTGASGTPALTLNTAQALGVGSSPAYGTAGQVLTSGGSGAAPSWTSPSAGAMTLISTQTASSSSDIQFTNLSGYSSYRIVITNLLPSYTDLFYMRFGYGAGLNQITSNYNYTIFESDSATGGSVNAATYNTGTPYIVLTRYGVGGSFAGFSGTIDVMNMSATGNTTITGSSFYQNDNSSIFWVSESLFGSSLYNSSVKTAIRFYFSSATITSGKVSLYGITS